MWWRKETEEQACVQVDRTYEGVPYPPEYIVKPAGSIQKIVGKLQNTPRDYQNYYMRKDVLPKLPALHVDIGDHGFHPEHPEVPIVAKVELAHNSPPAQRTLNWFQKTLILILAIAIPSIISTFLIFKSVAERQAIERACYLYVKNGQPTSIYIAGTEIQYPEQGFTPHQLALMNPWIVGEILNPWERCVIVNTQ